MATGNVRRRVDHFITEYVYPSVSNDVQHQYLIKPGQEYVSSLPLQMIIYFNVFYYPFWFIIEIIMLAEKFSMLPLIYKIVVIAILTFVTIIEVVRLLAGFVGNLSEKAPEMSGFWLLTLFLQLPLILFLLLAEGTIITPIERSVTIVMTTFIVLELVIGFFAMLYLFQYQARKFYMRQFTNLEEIENPDERRHIACVNPAYENCHDS